MNSVIFLGERCCENVEVSQKNKDLMCTDDRVQWNVSDVIYVSVHLLSSLRKMKNKPLVRK